MSLFIDLRRDSFRALQHSRSFAEVVVMVVVVVVVMVVIVVAAEATVEARC